MIEFSKSKTIVSIEIETIKLRDECSYLEAMIEWADENKIDVEDLPLLISDVLVSKLKTEQVSLNAVKSEKATSTGSLDQWL
ncbi:hypothetical protein [Citrobacter phage Ci1]|nr:hypothetical protein [Citrobacter phage Ci1]